MKSRHFLMAVLLLCIGFILFALYLQLVEKMLPCPLCVLQRYAFIVIGFFCLLGMFSKKIQGYAFAAFLSSLAGIGTSIYQLWVIAHPAVQCGRDSMEIIINSLWPAKWIPVLFYSDSLCGEILDSILGLTLPQWSLIWFFIFAAVFIKIMRRG